MDTYRSPIAVGWWWLSVTGLCLGAWLSSSTAGAKVTAPVIADPTAILNHPCMQAQTAQQCRASLSVCQKLAKELDQPSAEPQKDEFQAKVLGQLGRCESELGQYETAVAHFRSALRLLYKLYGPEHAQVATAINKLAEVLDSQGKYGEVEPLYRKALAMRQKLLGPEHPDIAESLNNLAVVLYHKGNYAEAVMLHRQALAMLQMLLGPEHPEVATILNCLAQALGMQGHDVEAAALHRKALAMRQRLLGPEHLDVAESLANLGAVYVQQGNYGEAETLSRQVLAMNQKLLGPESPVVASSLNNLGLVLSRQGKYREAESFLRQAIAVSQKLLGPEHPTTVISINNVAQVLQREGKYDEAEALYRQVLAIRHKILGAEHFYIGVTLHDLATLLFTQGKYDEAEMLYRQALAMLEKLLGQDHPEVASCNSALAFLLSTKGNNKEAASIHRKILERWKRRPENHIYVTLSLWGLAVIFCDEGRYDEAETIFRQVLTLSQKQLGDEHPNVASVLNDLAKVLTHLGRYSEAENMFRQALTSRKKNLGTEHLHIASSLSNMATLLIAQGHLATAIAYHRDATRIRELHIRATVSEARMQALLSSLRKDESTIYKLLLSAPDEPAIRQLAVTTALLRKGRSADAGTDANRLLHRNLADNALNQRFTEWRDIRQRREALLFGSPGVLGSAAYRAQLTKLQIEAESIESQLAISLPEIKQFQPPSFDAILTEVANRLPKNGALVEVVWVKPYQAQVMEAQADQGAPHYIALLLFPDQRIEIQDLGEATMIDREVSDLRTALGSSSSNPIEPAHALYKSVLGSLIPHLRDIQHLYLSLDGALNLVPFDALHDGTDYLLGRYRFHYLTSGRDLLRKPENQTAQPPLLIANLDSGPVPQQNLLADNQLRSLYQRLGTLGRLPGTEVEAQILSTLLGVAPRLGKEATEQAIRAAKAPWILHIATHGIFLADREVPSLEDRVLRSISMLEPRGVKVVGKPSSDDFTLPGSPFAMSQSALILAGVVQAQSATSSDHDGLLTAEEARSLDLFGTQLVVLSACQTGQGTLSAGQGVYGLRRAFLVAGAETLVSSLWRVDDAATGNLMVSYYRKLLDKEKPGDRVGAMQEAMAEMRAKPGRSHPYYWAPFVVLGQDGPLRRPKKQLAIER